jgi:hypothetical protein
VRGGVSFRRTESTPEPSPARPLTGGSEQLLSEAEAGEVIDGGGPRVRRNIGHVLGVR